MKNPFFVLLSFLLICISCKNEPKNRPQEITPAVSNNAKPIQKKPVEIQPIEHASMVLTVSGKTIYVDPVGEPNRYDGNPKADIILVTDVHGDHFSAETLQFLVKDSIPIIAPKAVVALMPEILKQKAMLLANGESMKIGGITIKAVPMYNLREEAKHFHPKGRGNGYVLDNGETRIYIAGDTGPIPEMRNLKNIDIAFIPMNLPYTMPVTDAADAVLDFKPKKVYPYHYRGENGMADLSEFKNLINTNNPDIEVIQLDWYPEE